MEANVPDRGWLVLLPDLTPDWDAFYAYWLAVRAASELESRETGQKAFEAQVAAAHVLMEAAWAERDLVAKIRKAELRAERREASIERRRRYNAAWMRDYRARQKAGRLALERHERRAEFNRRFRAEFIAGAEEDSRRRLGRGLTPRELHRVLRRYPGDL